MNDELSGLSRLSCSDWEATVVDAKPITMESMASAIQKFRDLCIKQAGETPARIVNPRAYREAERAQADGATPLEIEYCLIGYLWDDVKKAREKK